MKTTIIVTTLLLVSLVSGAFLMTGCGPESHPVEQTDMYNLYLVEVGECEYVLSASSWSSDGGYNICHHQNCRFCRARNNPDTTPPNLGGSETR